MLWGQNYEPSSPAESFIECAYLDLSGEYIILRIAS